MSDKRLLIDVRHVGNQVRVQIGELSATLAVDQAKHLATALTSTVNLVNDNTARQAGSSSSYDTERPDEEWMTDEGSPTSQNDT